MQERQNMQITRMGVPAVYDPGGMGPLQTLFGACGSKNPYVDTIRIISSSPHKENLNKLGLKEQPSLTPFVHALDV